jgi:hypothetical protein
MKTKLSKMAWVVLCILILLILVGGAFGIKKVFFSPNLNPDTSSYYAVFLTNGQVYFGNLKTHSEKEFVLTDVYYLQLENPSQTAQTTQSQLAQSQFSLIKMGNEIHGPTDELFINNQNILFYEKLRADSKVVQSISQSKK